MRELVFQKSFSANNVCTAFKGRWGENTVQRRRWQDYREENYLFSLYRHKSLFLMNSWMWQLNSCLDVMLLDAHLKFWGREKTQIIWVWTCWAVFWPLLQFLRFFCMAVSLDPLLMRYLLLAFVEQHMFLTDFKSCPSDSKSTLLSWEVDQCRTQYVTLRFNCQCVPTLLIQIVLIITTPWHFIPTIILI